MQKKLVGMSALLYLTSRLLFGAGLSVPELSIVTIGEMTDTQLFVLSTRINIEMLVEGGSKFDAMFKLGFKNPALENYFNNTETPLAIPPAPTPDDLANAIEKVDDKTGIGLRTVAITLRDIFSTPLELAVFVGHFDIFASGDEFPKLFGTELFSTKLRGFMYFPKGVGGDGRRWYNGLHEAFGTGIRLSMSGESLKPYFYLYQDSYLGAGSYSADLRILLNSEQVKMEIFGGASLPGGTAGIYRGGLLFYFNTGAIGDFYAQMGVPYWASGQAFGLDSLYFMFEPRVRFGIGVLTLSLFFHPAYYLQKPTNEAGVLDLKADVMFGNINKSGQQGGLEARLIYDPNKSSGSLGIEAAPYYQTVFNGVRWELKLNAKLLPFAALWYANFSPSIGVTTSY